jgi:hypothetical protein
MEITGSDIRNKLKANGLLLIVIVSEHKFQPTIVRHKYCTNIVDMKPIFKNVTYFARILVDSGTGCALVIDPMNDCIGGFSEIERL